MARERLKRMEKYSKICPSFCLGLTYFPKAETAWLLASRKAQRCPGVLLQCDKFIASYRTIAMREMDTKATKLKKTRDAMAKYISSVVQPALELLHNPDKPIARWKETWRMDDLKAMIDFKRGIFPADAEKLSYLNLKGLQSLFENKYLERDDPLKETYTWTEAMAGELTRMEAGVVEDLVLDTEMRNAIDNDNEYLQTRLALNKPRRTTVLYDVVGRMLPAEKKALLAHLERCILLDDFNADKDYAMEMLSPSFASPAKPLTASPAFRFDETPSFASPMMSSPTSLFDGSPVAMASSFSSSEEVWR